MTTVQSARPWGDELPEALMHVTSAAALPSISRFGLVAGAQWANTDVAAYHARLMEDAGHAPVVLSMPREVLMRLRAGPDWDALETPPLEVIMRDTAALNLIWTKGDPTPENCLALIGTMRTGQAIPASILHQYMPHLREQASRARNLQRNTSRSARKVKMMKKKRKEAKSEDQIFFKPLAEGP